MCKGVTKYMDEECKNCDLNQVKKVCSILSLDEKTQMTLYKKVKSYLKNVDMKRTNPEVMGCIWEIITKVVKEDDPYLHIKEYYNNELGKILPDVINMINSENDKFNTALKIAISGNLIDFAAKHKFDIDMLKAQIKDITEKSFAIDNSQEMLEELRKAHTLLYIGDNCGEVVLDKVFIDVIKEVCPDLTVYYGVRGKPIVNDVTIDDAVMAGMNNSAIIISNGDISLGTVIERTSNDFKMIYDKADIVMCKGQGNYEGMLKSRKDNLFFLFMAKCRIVAEPLGIPVMSIVCLKNRVDFIR